MPKGNFIPLKIRIKSIFGIVDNHLKRGNDHMKFSHLAPAKEEKLASFVPILHLSNSGKIFLRQPVHFKEIHMTLKIHSEEKRELEEELGYIEENQNISVE